MNDNPNPHLTTQPLSSLLQVWNAKNVIKVEAPGSQTEEWIVLNVPICAPPKHRSGYPAHLSDYTERKSQLLKVWGSSSQAEKGWLLLSGWRSVCASSGSLNILVSFSQVTVGWSWRRIDGSGPCLPKSVVAMKESSWITQLRSGDMDHK